MTRILLLVIFAGVLAPAWAAPPENPAFDAASLKLSPVETDPGPGPKRFRLPGRMKGGPGTDDPSQVTCTGCPIDYLIRIAYEKVDVAVTAPYWMSAVQVDLQARVPHDATVHDVHLMLQQLLLERFQLHVHHVSRQLPGYVLSLGKQAPKLAAVEAQADTPAPIPSPWMQDCIFRIEGHANTVSQVAQMLAADEGVPVDDRTGLTARYNFSLAWWPGPVLAQNRCSRERVPAGKNLRDAVKRQLGLKVQSRKLPGDAVVVDSALQEPLGN